MLLSWSQQLSKLRFDLWLYTWPTINRAACSFLCALQSPTQDSILEDGSGHWIRSISRGFYDTKVAALAQGGVKSTYERTGCSVNRGSCLTIWCKSFRCWFSWTTLMRLCCIATSSDSEITWRTINYRERAYQTATVPSDTALLCCHADRWR